MLYRNRYYHTGLGRFITRDPVGYDANNVNLYRYVKNAVLNRIDAEGLQDVNWHYSPMPTSGVTYGDSIGVQRDIIKYAEIYEKDLFKLCEGLDSPDAVKKGCNKNACLAYMSKIARAMVFADFESNGWKGWWEANPLANMLPASWGGAEFGGQCILWKARFLVRVHIIRRNNSLMIAR